MSCSMNLPNEILPLVIAPFPFISDGIPCGCAMVPDAYTLLSP